MTLKQLKIISTLIDNNLNVSLSANKLFRVQSALSTQLHLLENELGSKLFERQGKRLIKLTQLCEALLPEIERALIAENNIKALALEHTNTNKGELRIATTHTQARYFLTKTIGEFRIKYPEVRLSINQGSPAEFLNMLRQHKIDFAIFASEEETIPAGFTKTKCYDWNRILILPQNHPLEHTHPTLKKISQYPIITYIPDFSERNIIEKTFAKSGIKIDVAFSAGDTEIIKTYVHLKLGVAIVAQMAKSNIDIENADNGLVFCSLNHLFKHSTTYIVRLKDLAMREYMRVFSKLLCINGQQFQKKLNPTN